MINIGSTPITTPVKTTKKTATTEVSSTQPVTPTPKDITHDAQHLIYDRRSPPKQRPAEESSEMPSPHSGEQRRRSDPPFVDAEA